MGKKRKRTRKTVPKRKRKARTSKPKDPTSLKYDCGGKALMYVDYVSAVYHEGFKRLGYDLDAVTSSRGGKHV